MVSSYSMAQSFEEKSLLFRDNTCKHIWSANSAIWCTLGLLPCLSVQKSTTVSQIEKIHPPAAPLNPQFFLSLDLNQICFLEPWIITLGPATAPFTTSGSSLASWAAYREREISLRMSQENDKLFSPPGKQRSSPSQSDSSTTSAAFTPSALEIKAWKHRQEQT